MRLSQDLVEETLKNLPVKSLMRFKLVSKQWKMMIESQYFVKKQLKHRHSQEPDLLLIEILECNKGNVKLNISTVVLGSIGDQVLQPGREWALSDSYMVVSRGCDGLICIYDYSRNMLVVNPSTRWMREVPPSRFQLRFFSCFEYRPNELGFGKDICTGTYKLFWLYTSLTTNDNTTCEVFDFNTNTWRYVESLPRRIRLLQKPIYVDGSVHWLNYPEPNILLFDCYTETFQVFEKFPVSKEDTTGIIMCNINNRLCLSQRKWPTHDTWALNRSNMTLEKMFSLDLSSCPDGLLTEALWSALPLAILKKKKLLLFEQCCVNQRLFIYDLETKSYSTCFVARSAIFLAPYFQSLTSIGQQKDISIA